MDISVFKAICRELAEMLPGGRLFEAAEGIAGELCLGFRAATGGKLHLLMSPRPDSPRIYLTASKTSRAKNLSPSAQAIVNRIIGSTVVSVTQEGLERAVSFGLTRKTRDGQEAATLIYEMAGKKPNVIVLDGDGRVAIAQTYVPLSDDALRPLLPGMAYQPPPAPDKAKPYNVTLEYLDTLVLDNPGVPVDKLLFGNIGGISPLLAREVAANAGLGAGGLKAALDKVLARLDQPSEPCIIDTPKGPVLSAFPLAQHEGFIQRFDTMSGAAEAYYEGIAERKRFEAARDAQLRDARKRLGAAAKKRAALQSDMEMASGAERYKRYADLLMASPGAATEGAESVVLPDLFSEDVGSVAIPLDPKLGAIKNAQRYYNMARKANAGMAIIAKRLADTEKEVARIEAELERISSGEEGAARDESGDVTREAARRQPGKTRQLPEFPSFVSSDGFEVLYGKNAKANDLLSFKLAEPMDLWLHAQGYHGAHVIVRNPKRRPDIPLNTILEAASCAAYYSNARKDSSVAVDYTFRKYVRKPRDPVSGQAIFTRNKTVFVVPARPGEKN